MHIQLESSENNTIEAYSDHELKINAVVYSRSLLVCREKLIKELTLNSLNEIDQAFIEQLIAYEPEIVIIGHKERGILGPVELRTALSKQRIGLETMSFDAACRTYNILLNEGRNVMGLFIFQNLSSQDTSPQHNASDLNKG